METGPGLWVGLAFLGLGVVVAVAPFVSWSRYQKFVARSARVGGHVLDVETESFRTKDGTDYVHHAQVTYVAEDGRKITQIIDFDKSIDKGTELWLLHDRSDPWVVQVERDPQWLRKTVSGSVMGVVMAVVIAYLVFAGSGLVPDGGLFDE